MSGFKSAFIDTAVFIYYLEDNPEFGGKSEKVFQSAETNQASLFMTVLSYLEFCVKPYQEGRFELATTFLRFLEETNITCSIIEVNISDSAARLRAKYPGLKSIDALQLATAIKCNCEVFVTNDRRLRQVDEIRVMLLEEF